MPVSEGRLLATLLVDTARMQRTVFDRRMRKLGFTRTQWILLRRVDQQPGVSQSELAEALEVEKATAGRLIDRLAEYGWLERRQDEHDRRVNRIYLTQLGCRIHSKISPIAESMVRKELSGLSREERDQFGNLLMRVKKQLQEMAENEPIESEELERENA